MSKVRERVKKRGTRVTVLVSDKSRNSSRAKFKRSLFQALSSTLVRPWISLWAKIVVGILRDMC